MGTHLCRDLVQMGHSVVCTSRRDRGDRDGIAYIKGDAKDAAFLKRILRRERWGAVADFMVWSTREFGERYEDYLSATDQYVFVSSYRVYADSPVITEDSPRLLDAIDDGAYLETDEYALAKARCEDMLIRSGSDNWAIVRPSSPTTARAASSWASSSRASGSGARSTASPCRFPGRCWTSRRPCHGVATSPI